MTSHNVKVTSPQAAVIIWNYDDRLTTKQFGFTPKGNDPSGSPQRIEQIVIGTASLMGIKTHKEKSNPAGRFEIRLAPTFNWVTRITPGSWCTLIMTRDRELGVAANNIGRAEQDRDKMLGKIESVRFVTEVDQNTGARSTYYLATGVDWGAVFNQNIYIDPTAVTNNLANLGNVGQAARIFTDQQIRDWLEEGIPSCGTLTDGIVRIWGAAVKDMSNRVFTDSGVLISPQEVYELPTEVIRYYGLSTDSGVPSSSFGDLIHLVEGKLEGDDEYSGDIEDAFGFINPQTLYGSNSFWQVLQDNCNHILNELVTDVRWENGRPKLALYRRIRPFVNNPAFPGVRYVSDLKSLFSHVKKIEVDYTDVISINGGTNVRDRVNFVELLPDQQSIKANIPVEVNFAAQTKLDAAIFDGASINRDGFKPMKMRVKHLPKESLGKNPDPVGMTKWKHLVKEWHFNTHAMLNGSMVMIGQPDYIQVGDNIIMDSRVLGPTPNFSKVAQLSGMINPITGKPVVETYFTCHVESIEHNFEVDDTGKRQYTTTVNFVRGVITNKSGETLIASNAIVDKKNSNMTAKDEKNLTVNATSTESDPDNQKFQGGNTVTR